jgi:ankyrin repeat protein
MAEGIQHPASEPSFSSVAALWYLLASVDDGDEYPCAPVPPPLAPLMLHAVSEPQGMLVFAAGRGSPIFEKMWRRGVPWSQATTVEALRMAILHKKYASFEILLSRPLQIDNPNDRHAPTLLQLAAAAGSAGMLRQLLARFPEVDRISVQEDRTALDLAVRNGHSECIELLLRAGAEPMKLYLQMAIQRCDARLLCLLLSFGAHVDVDILQLAVQLSWWEYLPLLASCTPRTGETALMLALQAKDVLLVQVLLEKLSDAELEINYTFRNKTALSLAVRWKNVSLVQALLARGAVPDANCRALTTDKSQAERAIGRLIAGLSVQEFPGLYALS